MRRPYHGIDFMFDVGHLTSKDPLHQFEAWFKEICEVQGVDEPNAMVVATATK